MPRRRTDGLDFIDKLVDTGMEVILDRAKDFMGGVADRALPRPLPDGLPCAGCNEPTGLVCASCRRPFCYDHAEFYNNGGWCVCQRCFSFLWDSGKEKVRRLAKQGAVAAQQKIADGRIKMPAKKPWDVLSVDKDADEKTIKKAFKQIVLEFHPDVVEPDQVEAAGRVIDEAKQARDAMLGAVKSRSARKQV